MSAEIIDQANELAELQRESAIARYPSGAGNWWRAVSAALTVKKKRNYGVSIGGRDVQTNSERSALCRLPRMAGNYRQQRRQDGSLLAPGADQHRKHRPL
ncbi:phage/conjugal plasmid C-4 type zinc finger, TraR family domain protein [Klebsiella pneumoniae JHCK1]|nr:phage/conjugal plasmid C-4 type zinc finger, TraR family domain protein [Klebsiella pneumoniae JHCK1]